MRLRDLNGWLSRLYGQVKINAVDIIAERVGWKLFEIKALDAQLAAF